MGRIFVLSYGTLFVILIYCKQVDLVIGKCKESLVENNLNFIRIVTQKKIFCGS